MAQVLRNLSSCGRLRRTFQLLASDWPTTSQHAAFILAWQGGFKYVGPLEGLAHPFSTSSIDYKVTRCHGTANQGLKPLAAT